MADIHELCFTLYRSLYRIKISPYPFSGSFMPMDTHVGWRGGESFCCSPCYTFPYMLIHWSSFRKICIFPLLLWSFRHWLNFYIISSASAVKMQSEAINYDVRNQEHTSSLPLVSCQFPPNFLAWHSTFFFMLSNNPVNWFFISFGQALRTLLETPV